MLKQFVASIAFVTLSFSAVAEVLIKVPEEIVVVAINDQEVRGSLFLAKDKTYKLDDGQHIISMQYKQLFNPNYTAHEIVKSGIVTLNTGILNAGQYELVLINPPKDLDAAKVFAEQPVLGLKDAQGQIVAQQAGASRKANLWLGSGIFSSTQDLHQNKVEQPTVMTTPVQQIKESTLSKDQQLIELWKTATPQERQKFTAWLAGQAMQ